MKSLLSKDLKVNSIVCVEFIGRRMSPVYFFINDIRPDSGGIICFSGMTVEYILSNPEFIDVENKKNCKSYSLEDSTDSFITRVKGVRALHSKEVVLISKKIKDFHEGSENTQKIKKIFTASFYNASVGKPVDYLKGGQSSAGV